nr:MAG TPA: hypothetical protein [Bacteriophage sp.]
MSLSYNIIVLTLKALYFTLIKNSLVDYSLKP